MTRPAALLTHATAFVGPPALQALLDRGFRVLAHAPSFTDAGVRAAFEHAHPGAEALEAQAPEEVVDAAWSSAHRIDALLGNDVFPALHGPIAEAAIDDLRATLEALVVAPFRLARAAIPRLRAQGGGRVILVTSCRTALPMPGGAIPDAARAAANALVRSLALELAQDGIPVNAIAPNYLYSEAYFPRARFIDDPAGAAFIASQVPVGRLGAPEEIGELVGYLATMRGCFHTGTVIPFAGGWPAAPVRPG